MTVTLARSLPFAIKLCAQFTADKAPTHKITSPHTDDHRSAFINNRPKVNEVAMPSTSGWVGSSFP